MTTSTSDASYDLIIVGAGPAGATAALYAKRSGLSVLLLDKAHFPRDKVCGDALSGKSVTILRELGLLDQVADLPGIKTYLNSDRRVPFNQDGIFRHYPELDEE